MMSYGIAAVVGFLNAFLLGNVILYIMFHTSYHTLGLSWAWAVIPPFLFFIALSIVMIKVVSHKIPMSLGEYIVVGVSFMVSLVLFG